MITGKLWTYNDQLQQDTANHGPELTEFEQDVITEALRRYQKYITELHDTMQAQAWTGHECGNTLNLKKDPVSVEFLEAIRAALDMYATEKAAEAQADDLLEIETIAGVIDKYTGHRKRHAIQAAILQADKELKALAVRDIEKEAQQARDRFIERTKSMDSAQKYDAYSNCMMSTALLLVDRWGARFIPDICDALQLEQEELESTLNETDVLECIDLEGRETGTSAADDGTKSGTGAADPGTVSEIMKRLNRIEESLHSIGQQVEAIWLKTGAVELDAESIAEDLEETDTEQ